LHTTDAQPNEFHIAIPSEPMPKYLKAQNATAAKLLMNWDSMASPVLKMQADIHSAINSILKRSLICTNQSPLYLGACQMTGGRMD